MGLFSFLKKIFRKRSGERFMDGYEYLFPANGLNQIVYVNGKGELCWRNTISAGKIVGIMEFSATDKRQFNIPDVSTVVDYKGIIEDESEGGVEYAD